MKELYCVVCDEYKKFKNHKISYILRKTLFAVNMAVKMKRYLKRKNQLRY